MKIANGIFFLLALLAAALAIVAYISDGYDPVWLAVMWAALAAGRSGSK